MLKVVLETSLKAQKAMSIELRKKDIVSETAFGWAVKAAYKIRTTKSSPQGGIIQTHIAP